MRFEVGGRPSLPDEAAPRGRKPQARLAGSRTLDVPALDELMLGVPGDFACSGRWSHFVFGLSAGG